MNISTPPTTTMSSREFNQDTARAKRAAKTAPVLITDRGKPAYVLMSIEEFERRKGKFVSLAEAIADNSPEADFEWEPPRLDGQFFRIEDLD